MAISVALTGVILAITTDAMIPVNPIECIQDNLLDATAPVNNYFADHEYAKNTFMIICGLMMDVLMLSQFFYFAFF